MPDKQFKSGYRYIVNDNDVLYLKNNKVHHSTPYIQYDELVNRDIGNELSDKIKITPRVIERTLIDELSKKQYETLLTAVTISNQYELSKELFDSYRRESAKTQYNINEYSQNASIRAQYESGGSKSKKLKKRRVFTRKQHSKI